MISVFSWKRTFESVFLARSSPPGLCNVNNLAVNLFLKRPAHIPPTFPNKTHSTLDAGKNWNWFRTRKPRAGRNHTYVAHTFLFSVISERDSCLSCFLIPKITSAALAPCRKLKGPEHTVWTVPTRFACKHTPCIHMSMTPKLFPMFILLIVCALTRTLVYPPATPQIWTNSCRARHRLRAYDWWL